MCLPCFSLNNRALLVDTWYGMRLSCVKILIRARTCGWQGIPWVPHVPTCFSRHSSWRQKTCKVPHGRRTVPLLCPTLASLSWVDMWMKQAPRAARAAVKLGLSYFHSSWHLDSWLWLLTRSGSGIKDVSRVEDCWSVNLSIYPSIEHAHAVVSHYCGKIYLSTTRVVHSLFTVDYFRAVPAISSSLLVQVPLIWSTIQFRPGFLVFSPWWKLLNMLELRSLSQSSASTFKLIST